MSQWLSGKKITLWSQQYTERNINKMDENDATFDVFAELTTNTNYEPPLKKLDFATPKVTFHL